MRRLTGLAAPALLAGCLSVHVTQLRSAPADALPVEATHVELYVDGPPPREYVVVARLEVDDSGATNVELVRAMREKAADLGCDGLIVERGATLHGSCIFWANYK